MNSGRFSYYEPVRDRSLPGYQQLVVEILRAGVKWPTYYEEPCGRFWAAVLGLDAEALWEKAVAGTSEGTGGYRPVAACPRGGYAMVAAAAKDGTGARGRDEHGEAAR